VGSKPAAVMKIQILAVSPILRVLIVANEAASLSLEENMMYLTRFSRFLVFPLQYPTKK
jgi:hypothetical protein